jgi:hypothetical protein
MDDGSEGTMQIGDDGILMCMAAKAVKGAVSDELTKQGKWEQKWQNFKLLDAPMSAAWRVYFSEDIEVDAFAAIVAEVVTIIQPLAGEAAATNTVADFLASDEGKEESEKSMQAREAKSGRVLSEKNRTVIKTARESMQSGVAALDALLDATEPSTGNEDALEKSKAAEQKGRKSDAPTGGDAFQRFIELRKVMRAVNTAMGEALQAAKLGK